MDEGADGAPPRRIDAVDTYEWLPGRFALLHRVNARVGDQKVEGAEIIGYDPAHKTYITQYFGTDGQAYEASLGHQYGALIWNLRSETRAVHRHVQRRRQHDRGPLGVARR